MFISHAAIVGAFIVGVILVIIQFTEIIVSAENAPDESGDE